MRERVRNPGRAGFTLVEILVSLVLLSMLAAAVFPVITRQADEGDPVRVANDLGNIRTGIEMFNLNVRPELPGDLEDLANKIVPATDENIRGVAYVSGADASWNGPYISVPVLSSAAAADGVVTTGYGGELVNQLVLFDADAANGGAETTNAAVADFASIKVTGLSQTAFDRVNELVDGKNENTDALRKQGGMLRCPGTTCDPATSPVYYLAVPHR